MHKPDTLRLCNSLICKENLANILTSKLGSAIIQAERMPSELGMKEGIIMTKEEILAKSRGENKGADLAEMDERRKGWQASFFAGLAAIMIIITMQYATHHEMEAGALITVIMAMNSGMWVRSALKKRKADYILLALMCAAATVIACVHYFKYLIR